MTEINIKNEELISHLDNYIEGFYNIPQYNHNKYVLSHLPDDINKNDTSILLSRKYLEKELIKGYDHDGFPHYHLSQPIGRMAETSPELFGDLAFNIRKKFPAYLGVHSSALTNYYPPNGFVGWHTNWNANAYQVLFTWSKNGDGQFKYLNNENDEIITIKDKPGWQARAFYFGRKDEPEHHCWHAAHTNCDRFTFAYKFYNDKKGSLKDRQAQNLLQEFIYDIEGNS